MGEEITFYELFQRNVLTDKDLLDIGKKPQLKKIYIISPDYDRVQIHYGEDGWLFKEYECVGAHCC